MKDDAMHKDDALKHQNTYSQAGYEQFVHALRCFNANKALKHQNTYCLRTSLTIPLEDVELWLEFKHLVLQRYGKLKHGLSKYILELIEEEVSRNRDSKQHHTTNSMHNYRSDVIARLERFRRYLIDEGIEQMPEQAFIKLLAKQLALKDKRSIRKYYKIALELGVSKVSRQYSIFLDLKQFTSKPIG